MLGRHWKPIRNDAFKKTSFSILPSWSRIAPILKQLSFTLPLYSSPLPADTPFFHVKFNVRRWDCLASFLHLLVELEIWFLALKAKLQMKIMGRKRALSCSSVPKIWSDRREQFSSDVGMESEYMFKVNAKEKYNSWIEKTQTLVSCKAMSWVNNSPFHMLSFAKFIRCFLLIILWLQQHSWVVVEIAMGHFRHTLYSSITEVRWLVHSH